MEKSIQVFLSYAREDFEDAQKLYYRLEDAGIKPWMDKKNLFAGEKWEFAIRKAIRQSDLFLACLSKSSVQKRGFVQKEIRQAYDIWQEKLDSDIYLIPVRFEECDAPEKLSESNWVDLFEENGFDKLISAINEGANRQNILSVSQKAVKVGLSVQDKTFSESREQQPSYDIEISYPQFEGSGFTNLEELNTRILGEILEIVQQHRTIIFDEEKSSFLKDNDDTGGSSLAGGFEITILNPHLVSLMYDFSSYTYPAAHPNNWRQTANFYLNPVATIEIEQIFDYEQQFSV